MATRNIVPRATGEGSLGTSAKHWGNIYADNGNVAGRNIATDGSTLDALGNSVTTLQNDVTTLQHAYAGAKAAATVADMTDHNQIYVYVGSESGYTNGNWYYWNGTAWTSGGVYNATALETDKTLTVSGAAADAQITGIATENIRKIFTDEFVNIIPSMDTEWIDGYYLNSSNSGTPTENSNYCYTNGYIDCFGFEKVIGSHGFAFLIFYDKDKNFLSAPTAFETVGIDEKDIPSGAAYMRFSWNRNVRSYNSFVFLCSEAQYEALRLTTEKTNIPLTVGRQAIWGNSSSIYSMGEITDANDIKNNSIYIVQGESGTKIDNLPEGFSNDGSPYTIETNMYLPVSGYPQLSGIQSFKDLNNSYKFSRSYVGAGGWTNWIPSAGTVLECGQGKMFTTLKEAISVATRGNDVTVVVYPGTYDLNQEFTTEISAATGTVGNNLYNNIHLVFMAGSYVTVSFENTDPVIGWAYFNFNPFYSSGSYTIEGLNIYAKNTRYCVHDEMGGIGIYKHVYKNCVMEYENTVSPAYYVQCIGGGLGQNGLIYIEGGYYKSTPTVPYSSLTNSQQPISYHNGAPADIESKIFISNVYLADDGYFRFGYYGASTLKSKVYINGCRMGHSTLVTAENETSTINNFEVVEWGNTVVNPS